MALPTQTPKHTSPLHLIRSVCVLLLAVASTVCAGQSMYMAPSCREHTASLTDFGGVGDGATSNTKAFQSAVEHLSQYSGESGGGGMLYVPAGKWLTGPFNLTSHFTLYLHSDAVILGSTDMSEWQIIDRRPLRQPHRRLQPHRRRHNRCERDD
ncbi:hypothetical protein GUJ93_ZPchr0009g662 [Zizania palustris]|uniref:Rhamnogalacturonase A/B/Epimerase-like pectate lyase domain-containing protein n=1 Tax=Zizania palustris TaxID=103762 RepID=A0A8J5RR33_ZIZPA|nr:hypothetical protein GUJ93_ZPchr0009g662 [Zizania palustris]